MWFIFLLQVNKSVFAVYMPPRSGSTNLARPGGRQTSPPARQPPIPPATGLCSPPLPVLRRSILFHGDWEKDARFYTPWCVHPTTIAQTTYILYYQILQMHKLLIWWEFNEARWSIFPDYKSAFVMLVWFDFIDWLSSTHVLCLFYCSSYSLHHLQEALR